MGCNPIEYVKETGVILLVKLIASHLRGWDLAANEETSCRYTLEGSDTNQNPVRDLVMLTDSMICNRFTRDSLIYCVLIWDLGLRFSNILRFSIRFSDLQLIWWFATDLVIYIQGCNWPSDLLSNIALILFWPQLYL